MRKSLLLTLALLTASLTYLRAQPYIDVRTFSLRDGLAANVISSMGQTSDDMMWFGTWNGLCFYDGYRFTTYRDAPGGNDALSSNRIASIRPNSNGDVWLTSYDHHLYLFDTHHCRYVSIDKLLSSKGYGPLTFDRIFPLENGYTWITCDDNSNVTLRINDKQIAESSDGMAHGVPDGIQTFKGIRIWRAKLDAQSREWLQTSKGVYRVSAKGGLTATARNAKGNPFAMASKKGFTDSRHRTWIFSEDIDGVIMTNGKTSVRLQAKPRIPSERTSSSAPFFHEDEHGTVWVVPNGGTFSYYDEAAHRLVPYPLHTGEAAVACIPLIKRSFVDNQNNLWFSGERNLHLLNFHRHRVSRIPVVLNQDVRALCIDHEGNIWAGDHEGMLAVYSKDGSRKGFISPTGKLQQQPVAFATSIYSLMQDSKGRMWVGNKKGGLLCIDKGKILSYKHNDRDKWSLSHDDVYDMMEDSHHRIWIATYGGGINLVEEGQGKIRFLNANNVLREHPRGAFLMVRRLIRTSNGAVIASSNGGLLTFADSFRSPRSLHFYRTCHRNGDTTSLASNTVFQTLVTRTGRIFVSIMGGGLQEIVDRNLLHDNLKMKDVSGIDANEGLVQSMVEDNDGVLWLVRETTIDRYDARQNKQFTFSSYDLGYNLEFSEAKPLCSTDGQVLMACNGSYISFLPKDMTKSPFVPKIVFTSVQYQGEDTPVSILNTAELNVPSSKRSLTIFFSALDYSDNRLIRYAYKLEGSDDKWNYVNGGHSASFNHIPKGHQRLLVRSTNADGVWQENTRVLNIYAHPTFWESWMGWLLYIVIGGGLVFLAMYVYAQNQRIKMQGEMHDMMTQFFTNIGHKLRTPLTLIGGPVAEVMHTERLTDKGKELLDMVRRNSENMLGLVNSMLDYDHNTDNYLVNDENVGLTPSVPVGDGYKAGASFDIKLLVVEDNTDLRQFLFTILSSDYSVITAENGQQGLEKARAEIPDFIISDVMMPVMDGLAMVHELKQDKNTSHIPIIILSAKASMKDRLQGLREGIDDYITKPFSATYLKERVANIIARRQSLQQEVLAQLSTMQNSQFTIQDAEGVAETDAKDCQMASHKARPFSPDDSRNETAKPKAQGGGYRLSSPVIIEEDKVMMAKLMDYLEKHIDDSNLRLDDMAAAVNLGRTVFYGKMKSIVGMAPVEFVRHIRMQRAEELIVKSKESFSQIAYAVGFSDPKYFSKCFRKETGMSPSEYRAKGVIED